jgi:predicted metal-binding protein
MIAPASQGTQPLMTSTTAGQSTPTTLFVCSLCQSAEAEAQRGHQSAGEAFIKNLQTELAARNLQDTVHLTPLRCMAGCGQPCNASLAAPGKLTFILSGLSPIEGAAAVSDFCQQYSDSADGRVPYRDRPEIVQKSTAFVLPPLPTANK